MATPGFYRDISAEKEQIKLRYQEIDENINALGDERKAIQEREKLLDAVGELYLQSQKVIEDAQDAQLRLSKKLNQASQSDTAVEDRLGIELKTAELLAS